MDYEMDNLDEYMEKLDKKLDRQNKTVKTKNGIILFTPFFGKFERCPCIRSRTHHGKNLGIVVENERLRNRFENVEMKLKEFAKSHNLPGDFELIEKDEVVWVDVEGDIPNFNNADVTLRFNLFCFGKKTIAISEAVGITRRSPFEDEENEQIGYLNADNALNYIMDHYRC